jgi:CBS domain-containing protein
MVIGAFVGAAVWRIFDPLGWGVPHDPAPFVVVGMMACFGAIARAPLAMMLMVAEMTGSLTILAPAMAAVGVAYLIVRRADATIYRSQLHNRDEARAERLRTGMPLLDRITVAAAMAPPRAILHGGTMASAAAKQLAAVGVPGAPVVDEEGRFIGVATLGALHARADDDHDAAILNLTDTTVGRVLDSASLDEAVDALPSGHQWLTVIDDQRRVAGILAISDIVHAYHRALRADLTRLAGLTENPGVVETQIAPASPVVGKTLRTAGLPNGTIVLSVRRDNAVIAATGTTQLHAADIITAICRPEHERELRARLASDA